MQTFSILEAEPTIPAGSVYSHDLETQGTLAFAGKLPVEAVKFFTHAKLSRTLRSLSPYDKTFKRHLIGDGYDAEELVTTLDLIYSVDPDTIKFKSRRRYSMYQINQAMRGFSALTRLPVLGGATVTEAYLQLRSGENSIHKVYLANGQMRINNGVVIPAWCSEDKPVI